MVNAAYWTSCGFSGRIILWRAQIHLILGTLIFRYCAKENHGFAGAISDRFLGKLRTARCAVPLDIPKTSQISAQDRPSLRSLALLTRPPFTPAFPRHSPPHFST